jgi:hypothetical protein
VIGDVDLDMVTVGPARHHNELARKHNRIIDGRTLLQSAFNMF